MIKVDLVDIDAKKISVKPSTKKIDPDMNHTSEVVLDLIMESPVLI
jgi:hypothetical protein